MSAWSESRTGCGAAALLFARAVYEWIMAIDNDEVDGCHGVSDSCGEEAGFVEKVGGVVWVSK